MSDGLHLRFGPTVAKGILSDAFVVMMMGPRGEGKTVGGYGKLIYEAKKLPREVLPLKVLVVRDTWTNLNKTTIETLRELQRMGLHVRFLEDSTEAIIGQGLVHCFFVGLDRTDKMNQLQGFGAGVLWIEEPASAADLSSGVDEKVFGIGVTSLRQKGVRQFVLITMNPPDEDHWTMKVKDGLEELHRANPEVPMSLDFLSIPKGENEHITQEHRERNKAALLLIGRKDLVQRLVEGQVGQIVHGEQLTPEWSDRLHLVNEPLPIIRGVTILRGWDFGLNPTCFISQVTPLGRWHWLDCMVGDNIGLEEFLDLFWFPWADRYLGNARGDGFRFRDIGDPAGYIREQTSSKRSAVRTLTERLKCSFEAGAIEWDERLQSMKSVLSRNIKGTPVVQADPACKALIRACRGGAHYPKDPTGRVIQTVEAYKRASGIHSHPFDAGCSISSRVFPIGQRLISQPLPRRRVASPRQDGLGWMTV